MHLLLEKLGKHSVMIIHDASKVQRYDFLKNFDQILSYSQNLDLIKYLPSGQIESAIVLDVPSFNRLGDVSKLIPAKADVLKIDHHPLEDEMGQLEWIDVNVSSTTAMVYEIYKQSGIAINQDMATALYTGILYDTGRFSFSNTKARDYQIAAEMVGLGVKPADVNNRVFFENNFDSLKTIGKGLSSLENYLDGKVNVVYLSHQELAGQYQSEIEELANYSISVRGGEVGLFIREIEPDFHKISLRARNFVDVNLVAKAFDGGGHTRAAGCRISGTRENVIKKLLAEINKQLSKV